MSPQQLSASSIGVSPLGVSQLAAARLGGATGGGDEGETVVIPASLIGSDLTDFPTPINLAQLSDEFWASVASDGSDIRVFDSEGIRLPVDVVTIDTDAFTGWMVVKADLSSSVDTELTVDTGGSSPTLASPEALSITNPGAETGDVTGWTSTVGGLIARQDLGQSGDIAPHAGGGTFYFAGGDNAETVAHQDVAVPAGYESIIDAGGAALDLTWWLGGYSGTGDDDSGSMKITFLDDMDSQIGDEIQFPQREKDNSWEELTVHRLVPAGTRKVRLTMRMVRVDGTQNNAYIDTISASIYQVDPYGPAFAWSDYEAVYAFGGDLNDRTIHENHLTNRENTPDGYLSNIALALGGGVDISVGGDWQAACDNARAGGGVFTMAVTVEQTVDPGASNPQAMTRCRAFGGGTKRATLGERHTGNTWTNFDDDNSWNDAGVTSAADGLQHRLHAVYNGTVNRKLYLDGVLEATDTTITAQTDSNGWGTIVIGGGSSSGADWLGYIGFAYLRFDELSADWIAAERALLSLIVSSMIVGGVT